MSDIEKYGIRSEGRDEGHGTWCVYRESDGKKVSDKFKTYTEASYWQARFNEIEVHRDIYLKEDDGA